MSIKDRDPKKYPYRSAPVERDNDVTATTAPVTGATISSGKSGGADADEGQEDFHLILRVAARDRQAFELLYRRYAPRCGGYLWKLLRRHELVDEALNDAMLAVWQSAGRFDFRGRLSTWLFGIAHNKALKVLARSRRYKAQQFLEADNGADYTRVVEALQDDDDPEQHALRQEDMRQLMAGLAALSPDHQAVLELTFVQGFSYIEVAAIVECPVNTVKTRVFHARRQLSARINNTKLKPRTG